MLYTYSHQATTHTHSQTKMLGCGLVWGVVGNIGRELSSSQSGNRELQLSTLAACYCDSSGGGAGRVLSEGPAFSRRPTHATIGMMSRDRKHEPGSWSQVAMKTHTGWSTPVHFYTSSPEPASNNLPLRLLLLQLATLHAGAAA